MEVPISKHQAPENNQVPNAKALSRKGAEEMVEAWNGKYPVGEPVIRYKLVRPNSHPQNTQTRSAAWLMNDIPMVMVNGVSGGVMLESVEALR